MLRFKILQCVILICCIANSETASAQNPRAIIEKFLQLTCSGTISDWNEIKTVQIERKSFYDESRKRNAVSFYKNDLTYTRTTRRFPDHQKDELFSDSLLSQLQSTFYFTPAGK